MKLVEEFLEVHPEYANFLSAIRDNPENFLISVEDENGVLYVKILLQAGSLMSLEAAQIRYLNVKDQIVFGEQIKRKLYLELVELVELLKISMNPTVKQAQVSKAGEIKQIRYA